MGRGEPSRNEKTEDSGDVSPRTRLITTSVTAWCRVGQERWTESLELCGGYLGFILRTLGFYWGVLKASAGLSVLQL